MGVCRERWDSEYYNAVCSVFERLLQEDAYCAEHDISQSFIRKFLNGVTHYAHIKYDSVSDENPVVYLTILDNEYGDYYDTFHYVDAVGIPGYDVWEDKSAKWTDALREKVTAYHDDYMRRREERKIENERKKQLAEENRIKHEKRDADLQERILAYVTECKNEGVKPLKKAMVSDDVGLNVVYRVWKKMQEEGLI